MMRHSRRSCKEIQMHIIVYLSKYNHVGVNDLWEYMRTDWNTMHDAIDSLKRHQIIIIVQDNPEARRPKNIVTLTEKGKALVDPTEKLLSY